MNIIVVTGNGSNSGKTTFIRIILSLYPNTFDVIKLTPSSNMSSSIEKRRDILMQKGKDTAFFLEGGAKNVFWVHGKRDKIGNLLKQALLDVSGNVIIEGNSALQYVKPQLIFFVTRTLDGTVKESAAIAKLQAHYIILNNDSINYSKNGNVSSISLVNALEKPGRLQEEIKKIISPLFR